MVKKEPVIQVKDLYKIYRLGEEKVRALNGVDFVINRGEFCSIVGTSGSGKSTLLMAAGHHPNPYVEAMSSLTGSTDCYWDSYCNIRPYAGKEA